MEYPKIGRPRIYTEEQIVQMWEEYKAQVDDSTITRLEPIKSGPLAGTTMEIPIIRPYSTSGFCRYLGIALSTWYNHWRKLKLYECLPIIETEILTCQSDMAQAGLYNSNFTMARLKMAQHHVVADGDKKENKGYKIWQEPEGPDDHDTEPTDDESLDDLFAEEE